MRRMIAPALACLAVVVPVQALAAKRTSKLSVTSIANSIAPNQAPTLLAGSLKGSLGPGAVVFKVASAKGSTATAKFEMFTERGALKGTAHFSFTTSGPAGPGGTTTVKGKGSITAGTGTYKRSKGSFTVSGDSPPGQEYFRLTLKGSFTLP
jgi:hypothetical protein